MQRDHVRGLDHLVPGRIERTQALNALVGGEHHLHAEGTRDVGHTLADHAFADYAELLAVQVVDRMVEEAELRRLLPLAIDHVLAIADQAAAEPDRNGVRPRARLELRQQVAVDVVLRCHRFGSDVRGTALPQCSKAQARRGMRRADWSSSLGGERSTRWASPARTMRRAIPTPRPILRLPQREPAPPLPEKPPPRPRAPYQATGENPPDPCPTPRAGEERAYGGTMKTGLGLCG